MKRFFFLIVFTSLTAALSGCVRIPIPVYPDTNNVMFVDEFYNNDAGWSLSKSETGGASIENGIMRIFINGQNLDMWTNPGFILEDVRIDVDAIKVFGSDNNYFGVTCRDQGKGDYYSFLISSDGYYGISKVKNGVHTLLSGVQMRRNDDIQRGEAKNHITAICKQNQLSLAVNGILLAIVEDKDYPDGDVGLAAGSSNDPQVDVRFDHFIVTQPE